MMKEVINKYHKIENNSFHKNNNKKNISLFPEKKRRSLSHKRNTTILSDNSFISIKIKNKNNVKEKQINKNNPRIDSKNNSFNLNNKKILYKKLYLTQRKNTVLNDSLQYNSEFKIKDYSNLNINNETYKQTKENSNNNNLYESNHENDLFLSLDSSKYNYIIDINKLNKNIIKRNDKKKSNVLFLKTHDHFNSAMNSFSEYDDKRNKKKKLHLYNIITNKKPNRTNKDNIKNFNNKFIKTDLFKSLNNIKYNNKIVKNKNIDGSKQLLINKKIINLNNKEDKHYKHNIKIPNTEKETKTKKLIKNIKDKKFLLFKKEKNKTIQGTLNYTKIKNNNNFIDNLKKKFAFITFKNNNNINNNVKNIKDKNEYNNTNTIQEENLEQKSKKKIIVIKKKKKNDNKNEESNAYNLNEKKCENESNNSIYTNKLFESIEYQDNKDNKDNNDNNDNNLKIFEIISDTKIKSIIEYEKEKNNNDIQILKNNFDIRNNNETNVENNDNNKYMYKGEEEYNLLLRKESSKDTFSFRPTNNDSREISDQDFNFNNILLELEKNLKKNEEKHRIKIIKKKKIIKNYK